MFVDGPLELLPRTAGGVCFEPRRLDGSGLTPMEGRGSPEDGEARRRRGCEDVDLPSVAED